MAKEKKTFHEARRDYMRKLEDRMIDYMEMDASDRYSGSVTAMADCWKKLHDIEHDAAHSRLTPEELKAWADALKNSDGTTGAHWTLDQTSGVAKLVGSQLGHISPEEFWITMNMMYSDYGSVAEKFGVNKPEYFAELAKAFLLDKDGPDPHAKLAAYYEEIVVPGSR